MHDTGTGLTAGMQHCMLHNGRPSVGQAGSAITYSEPRSGLESCAVPFAGPARLDGWAGWMQAGAVVPPGLAAAAELAGCHGAGLVQVLYQHRITPVAANLAVAAAMIPLAQVRCGRPAQPPCTTLGKPCTPCTYPTHLLQGPCCRCAPAASAGAGHGGRGVGVPAGDGRHVRGRARGHRCAPRPPGHNPQALGLVVIGCGLGLCG